jgi:diaminohydroxyphosphoribosylaminopyrimidine deaminase/5-amino-6-(5-phosphoribosylamino)uracil reductase
LSNEGGYLDINEVVNVLTNKYNITSLLVEGGSQVISSFINSKLVDEIHFFIAPIIIGGGLQTFGHLNYPSIAKTPKLQIIKSETIGGDLHIIAKINFRNS